VPVAFAKPERRMSSFPSSLKSLLSTLRARVHGQYQVPVMPVEKHVQASCTAYASTGPEPDAVGSSPVHESRVTLGSNAAHHVGTGSANTVLT
jgi:hypothetical protein